jgi:hypothetical protein
MNPCPAPFVGEAMTREKAMRVGVLVACSMLAACGADPSTYRNENVRNETVPDAPPAPTAMQTLNGAATAAPTTMSAPTPTPTPSSTPTTHAGSGDIGARDPDAAVAVIRNYYAAIDQQDYRRAYRLWGDEGKASNQSFAGFTGGFAHTRHTSVDIGKPGLIEGAAGSSFITIPVSVSAVTDQGTRQRFTGSYVLRHVNDVPGATSAQRRWHITSASLKRAR